MDNCTQLRVSFLGGFTLCRCSGEVETYLSEQDSTSKRLWTFLQYLTVFHQRGITQEELIDVLWGDSDSANPVNTLKTLLHRGRAALEKLGFPDGKQVLLYRRGIYSWADEVQLVLDIDTFDVLCEQAGRGDLDRGLEAIALYAGDFLPNAAGNPWAVSLRTYYHTKYLRLCNEVAAALIRQSRCDEALRICQDAIAVEPYDEVSHLEMMKAMAASGAQQSAIQHYTYVTNLFMDHLGVSPSEEMTNFYRELTKANMSIELDLNVIRQQLLENRPSAGAFFCEYGVFQDIYRLEARSAIRNGRVVQLAMISLLDGGGRLESRRCSAAMDELRNVIQSGLRAGDTFTRFSPAQYLLLLPTASYENGIKVLQRILASFQRTLGGKLAEAKFSLLPVMPNLETSEERARFMPIKEVSG